MPLTMQFMLLIMLLAIVTAVSLVAGIILLPWKRTRPFGLYALLVEPGGVAGLICAAFIWGKLYNPSVSSQESQWVEWAVVGLLAFWLGSSSILGAISGFALATWLWWRFSPEPYRGSLVKGYSRLIAMKPWHRQRWGKRKDTAVSAAPLDSD
jgi:hypothetical protein